MKPLTMPYTEAELFDWLNEHSTEMKNLIADIMQGGDDGSHIGKYAFHNLMPEEMITPLAVTASVAHVLQSLASALAGGLEPSQPDAKRKAQRLASYIDYIFVPMYEFVLEILIDKATKMTEQKEAQA